MTEPEPSITVAVDPTNPGQFFACCGLLELADRLWPGAEGWFADDGREFKIACKGELEDALDAITACRLSSTMTKAQHARFAELTEWTVVRRKSAGVEEELKGLAKLLRESPVVLGEPVSLLVDWFTDDFAGGSRFKTWAGQQGVLTIATAMKEALPVTANGDQVLTFSAAGVGLPFNFDSDLGGQGGAIDIGFSFDPLAASALTRIDSLARPALELLAFIGLQRFRPAEKKRGENRFFYSTWVIPLPVEVAMAAACGVLPHGDSRFEFRLLYRTKYLKSFLPAIPEIGGRDE
jgi:CRISPR-associated protein Csb3